MVEGFICEYNKGQGFFCKKTKEWKGSLLKMRECKGVWAYLPFSSSSRPGNRGGRVRGRRRPLPAVQGTAAAEKEGERRRGARGMDSPPQFRRRGPAGRGATEASGGQPWSVWRRRCRARRRPRLEGKERGRRWDSFPSLTMDWGAAERASHGGRRRRAELARAAALEG